MRYILGLGAVFALVGLPASGCCHAPPPHTPAHQFGGYHSAPPQPHQLQDAGVQQYPGATELPPAQVPQQHQYQPPAVQHSPTGEFEQVVPDSSPTQGR